MTPAIRAALVAALAAALGLAASSAGGQAPTPVGVWQDDSARIQVEIAPCDVQLCGTLVWFKWPNDAQGLPLVDLKNTDPKLRGRPLLGLTILRGLRLTGPNTWSEGRIYNPDDGKDYRAQMTIQDDGALRMRSYVLVPLLGRTSIWKRIS